MKTRSSGEMGAIRARAEIGRAAWASFASSGDRVFGDFASRHCWAVWGGAR
jgi:hypothetical protein